MVCTAKIAPGRRNAFRHRYAHPHKHVSHIHPNMYLAEQEKRRIYFGPNARSISSIAVQDLLKGVAINLSQHVAQRAWRKPLTHLHLLLWEKKCLSECSCFRITVWALGLLSVVQTLPLAELVCVCSIGLLFVPFLGSLTALGLLSSLGLL